ncbi:MAG: ABC transporter ATP-binding protein [Candidatus Tyrphobacter sp.]
MTLTCDGVAFAYPGVPRGRTAIDDIALRAERGRTLSIVGPSGSGKSTLLRVIAGLLEPLRGDVRFDGKTLRGVPAQKRRIVLVFADDALFQTMSVRKNLAFAIRDRAPTERIDEVARSMQLGGHLDRMPSELSSGERQRAALARALLSSPRALLLDEPLAHLDPALKAHLRATLADVREHFDGPVIHVTHDHDEAMMVGDSLGVLVAGRLEDLGPPERVYDAPANVRAATALGVPPMNLVHDGPWIVGIRPEHVRIVETAALRGIVERCERAIGATYVSVRTERGPIVVQTAASSCKRGDAVALEFDAAHVRRFDTISGAAIP